MAVYKGREVSVLGKQGGEDTSPLYTIIDKSGNREDVQLNQIQFTEKELKDAKDGAQWHLDGAQVIADKDLQELRDGQDRAKIEKTQGTQKPGPVEVSKVMVDPSEVKDKSTITPQMTTDQRKGK